MDNQPPYQDRPSAPPPPPPGSGYTYYPESGSQGYAQPGPPPGYAPPPGPAFVPPVVYAQPVGVYVPEVPDPGKGMAIAGFVLGIISVCFICTWYGAISNIVIGGLGLTFSALGRKSRTSHGLAIAGLVMSIIGLAVAAVWVVVLVMFIIAAATAPHYSY